MAQTAPPTTNDRPVETANPSGYPWLDKARPAPTLASSIAPPAGFVRISAEAGGFADWLRHLPVKPSRPAVMLYNGKPKGNQEAHFAVIDIDTGPRDLQQCADAVMRLRAEYLHQAGKRDAIRFNFTSGEPAAFSRWAAGDRPKVAGNAVTWIRSAAPDAGYTSLRRYLDVVFAYAGTASLSKELRKVADPADMRIGDVFIKGGSPGHAVIVLDMAADPRTGRKVFLIAQSYMPAQDVHILKNPADPAGGPWYDLAFGDTLRTPEWTFTKAQLMRFE